jgi:hypothetical protein
MLYQLSYTPRPTRDLVAGERTRKAQRTIGRPTQLPLAPVNIVCRAAR